MPKPIIFATEPEHLLRDGLIETIQPWEDGLRAPTGRGHFEWWYFDAHFNDGSTAVIVFATKSILNPNLPLAPNLSLTITRPDGSKAARFALLLPGEFFASGKGCDIRMGASRVRQSLMGGRWTYNLHAEVDAPSRGEAGLKADLTFTGLVPPWRPGAGKSCFGDYDHYFAWLPAIPYGTVEGTLCYDGREVAVRGVGYHDHNWGSVALPSVMDHWYWGRAHVGEYSLIFVEQVALRNYGSQRLPVFLLAKGDRVLADDGRCLVMHAQDIVRHAGGREYPQRVGFTWEKAGGRVNLRLREPRLIEAVSLLLSLPAWQRPLARLFTNPYYFRFNTTLELEIELKDCQDALEGPALYEIMMLR